ncbi:hypothetical protein EDB80DRAFT_572198 [Ilyonectria destructans]|nr:hypothetical protein EDB80DRAFT_572198 [Ilyonectria destructans]
MCYQFIELYSACRCLYYQSAIDRCSAYGQPGHKVQQRTILVGYACSSHSGPCDADLSINADINTDSDIDTGGETNSSAASTVSTELTIPEGIKEDTVETLLHDLLVEPDLQYLWPQLVGFSGTKYLARRIIANLLRLYSKDLRQEGQSALKVKASSFIRSRRYQIARHIVNHHQAEIRGASVKPEALETQVADDVAEQPIEAEVEEDEETEAEDDEDEGRGVLYPEIHEFLFCSISFQNLKASIKLVVASSSLIESHSSVFTSMINSSQTHFRNLYDRLSEPRANPKLTRIWWTCGCGRKIYDDFTETRPDSVKDLKTFIDNYRSPNLSMSPMKDPLQVDDDESQSSNSNPQRNRFIVSELLRAIKNVFQAQRPGKLPNGEPRGSGHDISGCASTLEGAGQDPNHNFLILCIPFMRWGIKAHQPDVCRVRSDRDFFRLLRATHSEHNVSHRWKGLRRVSAIDFVQFEIFRNELVNICSSASMPGTQAQAEYEYEPCDTDPPIGTNMLLHLFENPDHADVLPILFRRFPKKKLRRLQACSQKGYSVGWGVQFVESLNGYAIFICGCVGFALCLLASILWTVLKNDVQGGFAVGAFVLTFFLFISSALRYAVL